MTRSSARSGPRQAGVYSQGWSVGCLVPPGSILDVKLSHHILPIVSYLQSLAYLRIAALLLARITDLILTGASLPFPVSSLMAFLQRTKTARK